MFEATKCSPILQLHACLDTQNVLLCYRDGLWHPNVGCKEDKCAEPVWCCSQRIGLLSASWKHGTQSNVGKKKQKTLRILHISALANSKSVLNLTILDKYRRYALFFWHQRAVHTALSAVTRWLFLLSRLGPLHFWQQLTLGELRYHAEMTPFSVT